MEIFKFNPADTTVKILLAHLFSPKDFKKNIAHRERSSLLYILNGKYRYTSGETSFVSEANSLIYSPTGSVPYTYEIFRTNENPIRVMQIEFEISDSEGRQMSFFDRPVALAENPDAQIRKCFEAIIANHIKNDHVSHLTAYAEFYRLLSLCAACSNESKFSDGRRKTAPAFNFIQENYRNHFSVSELAEMCHVSESQLRRIFVKEFGCSPLGCKNELLLRDACNLLKTGEFSIGEISEILGFCDIYAFSHFFKKNKGVSPSKYISSIFSHKTAQ